MTAQSPNPEFSTLAEQISADLLKEHGPMLGGKSLCKTLGYSSMAAFRQAYARGTVPVTVFPIERRRGKYALANEVARWLAEQRLSAPITQRRATRIAEVKPMS